MTKTTIPRLVFYPSSHFQIQTMKSVVKVEKDKLSFNPNKCSFLSRTFVSVFYGEKNTFLFSRTFDCSCPVWTLMSMLAVTDWTRRRWTPQADRLLLRITEGMIKHHPHYDDHHHHHHHHHHSHPQMWVPESIPIWPWETCLLSWWNHILNISYISCIDNNVGYYPDDS